MASKLEEETVPILLKTDSPYRKVNFQGKSMLVGMIHNWPFIKLETGPDGKKRLTDGIDFNILETLKHQLNFT